jgi:endonuclease/exonuclease/phosphatase family metal-dependent hydrolase
VKRVLVVVALSFVVSHFLCAHHERGGLRFATFNIEDFPKDDRQVDGAFAEIAATGASFVAVQEISEPARFLRELRARLGESWRVVFVDTSPAGEYDPHHNGVAYDARVWRVVGTEVHDETRAGRQKPTLEVRLAHCDEVVRVFVIHFKSRSEYRPIREQQFAGLRQILAQTRGDRVIVLGDFNATEEADREDLAATARAAGLVWATESLACSAFWRRDDGCPRSRLDHVLMSARPDRVRAAGACATDGCDYQDSCPLYAEQVSDHCPVVVDVGDVGGR